MKIPLLFVIALSGLVLLAGPLVAQPGQESGGSNGMSVEEFLIKSNASRTIWGARDPSSADVGTTPAVVAFGTVLILTVLLVVTAIVCWRRRTLRHEAESLGVDQHELCPELEARALAGIRPLLALSTVVVPLLGAFGILVSDSVVLLELPWKAIILAITLPAVLLGSRALYHSGRTITHLAALQRVDPLTLYFGGLPPAWKLVLFTVLAAALPLAALAAPTLVDAAQRAGGGAVVRDHGTYTTFRALPGIDDGGPADDHDPAVTPADLGTAESRNRQAAPESHARSPSLPAPSEPAGDEAEPDETAAPVDRPTSERSGTPAPEAAVDRPPVVDPEVAPPPAAPEPRRDPPDPAASGEPPAADAGEGTLTLEPLAPQKVRVTPVPPLNEPVEVLEPVTEAPPPPSDADPPAARSTG